MKEEMRNLLDPSLLLLGWLARLQQLLKTDRLYPDLRSVWRNILFENPKF